MLEELQAMILERRHKQCLVRLITLWLNKVLDIGGAASKAGKIISGTARVASQGSRIV